MPGLPKRERVISSIDGLNLYFGIKASDLRHHLWLDLVALSNRRGDDERCFSGSF